MSEKGASLYAPVPGSLEKGKNYISINLTSEETVTNLFPDATRPGLEGTNLEFIVLDHEGKPVSDIPDENVGKPHQAFMWIDMDKKKQFLGPVVVKEWVAPSRPDAYDGGVPTFVIAWDSDTNEPNVALRGEITTASSPDSQNSEEKLLYSIIEPINPDEDNLEQGSERNGHFLQNLVHEGLQKAGVFEKINKGQGNFPSSVFAFEVDKAGNIVLRDKELDQIVAVVNSESFPEQERAESLKAVASMMVEEMLQAYTKTDNGKKWRKSILDKLQPKGQQKRQQEVTLFFGDIVVEVGLAKSDQNEKQVPSEKLQVRSVSSLTKWLELLGNIEGVSELSLWRYKATSLNLEDNNLKVMNAVVPEIGRRNITLKDLGRRLENHAKLVTGLKENDSVPESVVDALSNPFVLDENCGCVRIIMMRKTKGGQLKVHVVEMPATDENLQVLKELQKKWKTVVTEEVNQEDVLDVQDTRGRIKPNEADGDGDKEHKVAEALEVQTFDDFIARLKESTKPNEKGVVPESFKRVVEIVEQSEYVATQLGSILLQADNGLGEVKRIWDADLESLEELLSVYRRSSEYTEVQSKYNTGGSIEDTDTSQADELINQASRFVGNVPGTMGQFNDILKKGVFDVATLAKSYNLTVDFEHFPLPLDIPSLQQRLKSYLKHFNEGEFERTPDFISTRIGNMIKDAYTYSFDLVKKQHSLDNSLIAVKEAFYRQFGLRLIQDENKPGPLTSFLEEVTGVSSNEIQDVLMTLRPGEIISVASAIRKLHEGQELSDYDMKRLEDLYNKLIVQGRIDSQEVNERARAVKGSGNSPEAVNVIQSKKTEQKSGSPHLGGGVNNIGESGAVNKAMDGTVSDEGQNLANETGVNSEGTEGDNNGNGDNNSSRQMGSKLGTNEVVGDSNDKVATLQKEGELKSGMEGRIEQEELQKHLVNLVIQKVQKLLDVENREEGATLQQNIRNLSRLNENLGKIDTTVQTKVGEISLLANQLLQQGNYFLGYGADLEQATQFIYYMQDLLDRLTYFSSEVDSKIGAELSTVQNMRQNIRYLQEMFQYWLDRFNGGMITFEENSDFDGLLYALQQLSRTTDGLPDSLRYELKGNINHVLKDVLSQVGIDDKSIEQIMQDDTLKQKLIESLSRLPNERDDVTSQPQQ